MREQPLIIPMSNGYVILAEILGVLFWRGCNYCYMPALYITQKSRTKACIRRTRIDIEGCSLSITEKSVQRLRTTRVPHRVRIIVFHALRRKEAGQVRRRHKVQETPDKGLQFN